MRRIRIVLLHSQFKMQCPNFLHPPWWAIPLPDESARGQFLQGYSYPSKHVLYHHHPALNLTSTNQSVGSQWTIWLWHTHTHTHTYTHVHTSTHTCSNKYSQTPMLLMQAGEVSFSNVTVIRPPRAPSPSSTQLPVGSHLVQYQIKTTHLFPINLQPECQAQQCSGLPVVQYCINTMFISNQATPAPSL